MIRFGAWSTLLFVPAAQAVIVAALILRGPTNRVANRYLAALLIVLAGILAPFILGYAGAYDRFTWLSFAPISVPLLVGPLAYGYVGALVTGERMKAIHLAPGALQFGYQAFCFVQPIGFKNWFDNEIQEPYLTTGLSAGLIVSLACYAWAGAILLHRYRRASGSEAAFARVRRLSCIIAALILLVAARSLLLLYKVVVGPVSYFDLFGYYVLLALITAYLSIEGWRQAGVPFPAMAPPRDWSAQGENWRRQLTQQGWWREPGLSLGEVARRLATNETHLSRALSASGNGFSETVAALRAEEAARLIRTGDSRDLLSIALESGFGSKASFNRAFKDRFGTSPSAYRAASASQSGNFSSNLSIETTG